jgi:hypothetical protein
VVSAGPFIIFGWARLWLGDAVPCVCVDAQRRWGAHRATGWHFELLLRWRHVVGPMQGRPLHLHARRRQWRGGALSDSRPSIKATVSEVRVRETWRSGAVGALSPTHDPRSRPLFLRCVCVCACAYVRVCVRVLGETHRACSAAGGWRAAGLCAAVAADLLRVCWDHIW